MPFTRLFLLVLLGSAAAPALAANGTWELLTETGGCTVSLVPEMVDDGIFFVDRGSNDCGADLNRITGYALNEDGAEVVFYSTLEGVDHVGQVSRESEGLYRGSLRNGLALRLEHKSGPAGIADPRTGLTTGEEAMPAAGDDSAETIPPGPDGDATEDPGGTAPDADADAGTTAGCLSYPGSAGVCADDADLGAPPGGQLLVLTRMNLRDAGTTEGSSVTGRAEPGQCLTATFCQDDGSGRLWCGVQGEGVSGYLLKQDADTVYLKNRCD